MATHEERGGAFGFFIKLHLILCVSGLVLSTITLNPVYLSLPAIGAAFTLIGSMHLFTRAVDYHGPLLLFGMGCAAFMAGSVFTNFGESYNGLLNALYVFGLGVILPQALWGRALRPDYIPLHKTMVLIGALILPLTIYWKVSGLAGAFRFGEPFAPGVFGFYMVMAALCSLPLKRGKLLFVIFAFFAVFSQSRFAVLGLLVGVILYSGISVKRFFTLALVLGIGALALYIAVQAGWDPAFLQTRRDVSSGRFLIWTIVWDGIQNAPLLGNGVEPVVYGIVDDPERYFGAHNSFLSLSYQFGIPVAVLCYLFFVTLWIAAIRNPYRSDQEKRFLTALAAVLLMRSMVTNTFWTNMADAPSLFVLLMLVHGLRRPNYVHRGAISHLPSPA